MMMYFVHVENRYVLNPLVLWTMSSVPGSGDDQEPVLSSVVLPAAFRSGDRGPQVAVMETRDLEKLTHGRPTSSILTKRNLHPGL